MSDVVVTGGSEPLPAPEDNSPLTIHEAVDLRIGSKPETTERKRDLDGRFAQPESVSPSQETDAAPPQEAPGETTEPDPAEELPSIEPPRSWTKEAKEAFRNLSPEHQQQIVDSEKEREKDFRRRQNETAELKKRHEAEATALQQARQQYERALPQLAQAYQAALSNEFSDIRSQQDVDRLALENPSRWVAYQNVRQRAANAQAQLLQAQAAQQAQAHSQWAKWSAEQDAEVIRAIPDLADKEKSAAVLKEAQTFLNDLGFSDDELRQHLAGQRVISMRDARLQQIVWEAAQYRKAKAGLVKAKQEPKPAPKVQRPGTGRTAGLDAIARAQSFERKISEATTTEGAIRAAMAARRAHREAARKAS